MAAFIEEVATAQTPESLVVELGQRAGTMLLGSARFDSQQGRYSFVVAEPLLTFRSYGARCEIRFPDHVSVQFGNPWRMLDDLMARYELLDEIDFPFPLGGCFGYWGYDLKHFVEPKLQRQAVNDLELPDSYVGFYDSLVVFDHQLGKTWLVSTGLTVDGSRSDAQARERARFWKAMLWRSPGEWQQAPDREASSSKSTRPTLQPAIESNLTRREFIAAVRQVKDYIAHGHIYQVNLSQRLAVASDIDGWPLFQRFTAVSPAPFAAYINAGDFEVISSSPELFLRISGGHITTRPIKGTRPRSSDLTRDAQLTYQLQTSQKELSELVMITDLLRNDIGRVCEYGSVQVPEIIRLERYCQVQHLVSTIEGRLADGVTHFQALAACFPGGSITGVPKIRAMEIIDELEPLTRGPYTGSLGYLGFNRESQVSIVIRAAIRQSQMTYFYVGAGIVADSDPEAEYEETLAKAGGLYAALELPADLPVTPKSS